MKFILILLFSSFAFADGRKISQDPFDQGVSYRISNMPIDTCGDGRGLTLFCREGWYMTDALSIWTYQRKLTEVWAFPIPRTELQAVSIGLALRFSGYETFPMAWQNLGKMTKFVADGWGFADEYLGKGLEGCPIALQDYCAFGQGRASYFTGRKFSDPSSRKGRDFARAMHGETGTDLDQKIAQIARAILSRDSVGIGPMMNCLTQFHAVDCTRSP